MALLDAARLSGRDGIAVDVRQVVDWSVTSCEL